MSAAAALLIAEAFQQSPVFQIIARRHVVVPTEFLRQVADHPVGVADHLPGLAEMRDG